jgi:hypothetical protein
VKRRANDARAANISAARLRNRRAAAGVDAKREKNGERAARGLDGCCLQATRPADRLLALAGSPECVSESSGGSKHARGARVRRPRERRRTPLP